MLDIPGLANSLMKEKRYLDAIPYWKEALKAESDPFTRIAYLNCLAFCYTESDLYSKTYGTLVEISQLLCTQTSFAGLENVPAPGPILLAYYYYQWGLYCYSLLNISETLKWLDFCEQELYKYGKDDPLFEFIERTKEAIDYYQYGKIVMELDMIFYTK